MPSVTVTFTLDDGYTPSSPLDYRNQSDVLVEGLDFADTPGPAVYAYNVQNLTVRNCRFTNCYQGVKVSTSTNIIVEDCTFTADQTNRGRNSVQLIQCNLAYIARNTSTRLLGGTQDEDHFSIFRTNGTLANPVIVEDNYINGGGPSTSASGIVLGDKGGDYQIARNNTVIHSGSSGIGVVGGTGHKVLNNKVYSSATAWSNVGIVVWDVNSGIPCSDIEVRGNQVDWTNKDGVKNPRWTNNACGPIDGWDDNEWNADLSYLAT